MTRMAQNFADAGMVPADRDVGWAVDTLYVLVGPETWDLLRHELRRNQDDYRAWLEATLRTQFLGSD